MRSKKSYRLAWGKKKKKTLVAWDGQASHYESALDLQTCQRHLEIRASRVKIVLPLRPWMPLLSPGHRRAPDGNVTATGIYVDLANISNTIRRAHGKVGTGLTPKQPKPRGSYESSYRVSQELQWYDTLYAPLNECKSSPWQIYSQLAPKHTRSLKY